MRPEFAHKRVVIVGCGKTGLALARFFSAQGARVTVSERKPLAELAQSAAELRSLGVALESGGHRRETFLHADLIGLSPGVPPALAPLAVAREKGIPVVGEIELAARFIRQPVAAVTGTNGKTTTVTLLGDMLRASGRRVFVGGNIGRPLIEFAAQPNAVDLLVVELSSFQLDTLETLRPRISVLLNISEDHLDRYADMAAYAASKARIFKNQQAGDNAIFNAGDHRVWQLAEKIAARRLAFVHAAQQGLPTDEGAVIGETGLTLYMREVGDRAQLDLSETRLPGTHSRENICAAAMAALVAGATLDGIREALAAFKGLPHRLAPAGRFGGVEFINDSKATNVDAVAKALQSFVQPIVLIMGGRSKGSDFSALKLLVQARVRKLIVMGEARRELMNSLSSAVSTAVAEDMADAVRLAFDAAHRGDVVLLAPGCASFDRYSSYRQRGEDFMQQVVALQ